MTSFELLVQCPAASALWASKRVHMIKNSRKNLQILSNKKNYWVHILRLSFGPKQRKNKKLACKQYILCAKSVDYGLCKMWLMCKNIIWPFFRHISFWSNPISVFKIYWKWQCDSYNQGFRSWKLKIYKNCV